MYGNLIFGFATAWVEPLTGLVCVVIVLDLIRSMLFYNITK